jgi:hypothetical protein
MRVFKVLYADPRFDALKRELKLPPLSWLRIRLGHEPCGQPERPRDWSAMILRRVIDHIGRQAWTAIVIEFVIVVIGIFVGLQVNNWNTERANRALESTHLAQLAKDIRSDLAEMDRILHVSTVRMSVLNRLLAEASGKPMPDGFDSPRGRIEVEKAPPFPDHDPNSVGIALFILSTLDGNRSTYQTIINTGGLGIIRDSRLVREILDYYASVDGVRSFEAGLSENRDKLVEAERELGISPVQGQSLAEFAMILHANAPLLAAAQNYWLYTNRHLKLIGELRVEAERLASHLEGSRGGDR